MIKPSFCTSKIMIISKLTWIQNIFMLWMPSNCWKIQDITTYQEWNLLWCPHTWPTIIQSLTIPTPFSSCSLGPNSTIQIISVPTKCTACLLWVKERKRHEHKRNKIHEPSPGREKCKLYSSKWCYIITQRVHIWNKQTSPMKTLCGNSHLRWNSFPANFYDAVSHIYPVSCTLYTAYRHRFITK